MHPFVVRKIDPSTSLWVTSPGSVPEFHHIESVLTKAFTEDHFTAIVTGQHHHAPVTDTNHICSSPLANKLYPAGSVPALSGLISPGKDDDAPVAEEPSQVTAAEAENEEWDVED
ncbi:hypothetical protein B0H11DRAFT_2229010 [Mycena galericulata]|nr:hypothetical protein B0H11DRAFT_2229010 [Mycena galericulata]